VEPQPVQPPLVVDAVLDEQRPLPELPPPPD
jgi:hypothetical protein